jgi:hypothetical protein
MIVKPRNLSFYKKINFKIIYNLVSNKMPFKLEKIDENKYYVITKDTGKRHSLHPLTHDKARAQLYVLEKLYEEGKIK